MLFSEGIGCLKSLRARTAPMTPGGRAARGSVAAIDPGVGAGHVALGRDVRVSRTGYPVSRTACSVSRTACSVSRTGYSVSRTGCSVSRDEERKELLGVRHAPERGLANDRFRRWRSATRDLAIGEERGKARVRDAEQRNT
jgi:hypothetical protein